MTRLIDADKLLEWANNVASKEYPYDVHADRTIEFDQLEMHIECELGKSTEPKDWQVGDRVFSIRYWDDHICTNQVCKVQNIQDDFFSAEGSMLNLCKEDFHNIDAERRALEAEIAALKNPWCYDLDKAPYNKRIWVLLKNDVQEKRITKVLKKVRRNSEDTEECKIDWYFRDTNKDMDKFIFGYNEWGWIPIAWCDFVEPNIPEPKGGA